MTDPRNQKNGHELEQDLESVRSGLSSLETVEPPELLDQAVLNTARREIEFQRERRRKRGQMRWLGAFATASVVVLAFTLVIQQDQPVPEPMKKQANGLRLDHDVDTEVAAERSTMAASPPMEAELKEEADSIPDAKAWITRLIELKENHLENELEEELKAFRLVFPDYPLPPELDR